MSELNKDIGELIAKFTALIRTRTYEKNLLNTITLCKCNLETVFEIGLSILACLKSKQLKPAIILSRSMLEYATDINYLALMNDVKLNKQYKNYFILLLKWYSPRFESQESKDKLPWIDDKFIKHVAELSKDLQTKEKIIDYRDIKKRIKQLYQTHWTGLDFASRMRKIKKAYTKNQKEFLFDRLEDNYKIGCNYVHSNVYGGIPHFQPEKESFEFEYNVTHDFIETAEEGAFIILEFAISGYIYSLPRREQKSMFYKLQKITEDLGSIQNWLYS